MSRNEFDFMYDEFLRKFKEIDDTHHMKFEGVCGWSLEILCGTIYKVKDDYKIIVNRSCNEILNKILSKDELLNLNYYLDTLRSVTIKRNREE